MPKRRAERREKEGSLRAMVAAHGPPVGTEAAATLGLAAEALSNFNKSKFGERFCT